MFTGHGRKRIVPLVIVIIATLVIIYHINRSNLQIISHSNHHEKIDTPKLLPKTVTTAGIITSPSSTTAKFVCGKNDVVCSDDVEDRIDCYPVGLATEKGCKERGCCWGASSGNAVPSCYFPVNYGYQIRNRTEITSKDFIAKLRRCDTPYYSSKALTDIMVTIEHYRPAMLSIKFYDPRYYPSNFSKQPSNNYGAGDFYIYCNHNPFALKVIRRSTGKAMFDTSTGGFIFENDLVQLSSKLGSKDIFGLEGDSPSGKIFNWKTWKTFTPKLSQDAIGTDKFHFPGYIVKEDNNDYYIVALRGHQTTKFTLQPKPSITIMTTNKYKQLELLIYAGNNPIINFYSFYYNASITDPEIANINLIPAMKTRLLANINPVALKVLIQKFQPAELNRTAMKKSYVKLKMRLQRWAMPYNNTYIIISWVAGVMPNAYDYIAILCKKKSEAIYQSCYQHWLNMRLSDRIVTNLGYDKDYTYYIVYYTYSCNKTKVCGFLIKEFESFKTVSPSLTPEDDGYGYAQRPHPLIPPIEVNMENTKRIHNVTRYRHNPYLTASGQYTFKYGIDKSLTFDLKWFRGDKALTWDYVAIYRHYPRNVSNYIQGQWCWVANYNNSCNTVVEFARNRHYYVAYITYSSKEARFMISEVAKFHNFTNWMAKYKHSLQNLRLQDLVIPGTYCSACYNMSAPMLTPWSQTQTENIANQLRDGIRYFDLRVRYLPSFKTKFWLSHNKWLSKISVTSFLHTIKTFAARNINEVLIIHFVDFYDFDEDTIHDNLLDVILDKLKGYAMPKSYAGKVLATLWKDNTRILTSYNKINCSSKYQDSDLVWGPIHSVKPIILIEREKKLFIHFKDYYRTDNKSLSISEFTTFDATNNQIPFSIQTLSNKINPKIDDWLSNELNKVQMNIVTSNYYLGNNMICLAIRRNIAIGKKMKLTSDEMDVSNL
ncbi:Sucrase-isomaltase, intestinal [Trichoplax sp. H2]|uniref:P-type domain-containing protein n=1 Tax=Trichoplax adhaerens TaxID=10228 RepID=B3RZF6_TRIAD|nr:hypothetical protein TRIADDRAFT_57436 [Trichoplax adhaerens]EDV24195.1 hypothetical protein TRIADDRAFT_57436 [Trichoplax adhaerens]RDD39580.1 Sucrase-isomaltase, intestinal [Trichoplax sp. H2]|eukprot:XP_002113721.1 hypothetical protein TRIADDRAFT_57436 [Trichoplax adhaerens]